MILFAVAVNTSDKLSPDVFHDRTSMFSDRNQSKALSCWNLNFDSQVNSSDTTQANHMAVRNRDGCINVERAAVNFILVH
uniref:Uncharacterized protein n=1 Tax=Caenorhabditis japonica TaxID=281687 RepID=A0A8R1EMC7_CAEJA